MPASAVTYVQRNDAIRSAFPEVYECESQPTNGPLSYPTDHYGRP